MSGSCMTDSAKSSTFRVEYFLNCGVEPFSLIGSEGVELPRASTGNNGVVGLKQFKRLRISEVPLLRRS
jgi:hypothetical protein